MEETSRRYWPSSLDEEPETLGSYPRHAPENEQCNTFSYSGRLDSLKKEAGGKETSGQLQNCNLTLAAARI